MQQFDTKKSVKKNWVRRVTVNCTLFLFSILYTSNGFANVYVPTTFTDPAYTAINNATGVITAGAGVGLISLRSALQAADALGGTHTITLSTGTYDLTQAIPNRQITIGNTAQNITINGNGPANTIINMVNDANRDRILFINPVGTTDNVITNVSGITFQNGYLSSDPFGGAGICAGGGLGNALTVTNCAFTNNTLPAGAFGGAAVCMQVSGDLTVDNCTFTNNVSNDADGGAVLFIIFNNNPPGYDGDLLVTNSTFTGNSVVFPGAPASNGGALAFTGQGGIVGTFNVTINNNTFLNNTADGYGGAISANNSPALSTSQIHFNRFVGNTSATSATTSAMLFVNSDGSVNAENNWWGCNTGPTAAGACDKAAGIGAPGAGVFSSGKWLQLKTTASPNPICNTAAGLGNTTTVTTSFLSNSAAEAITVANVSRLIGLPVVWGPTTLGSLSGQQGTIQASGTATATFTSNGTGGTATVNTQVDNVPAAETTPSRANITVNTLPIVTNPANFTSCVGGTATFTSTITGTPAPTITWRIGTTALVNGLQGSGSTVSGQGTNTLTITNVQPGDAAINYNVQAVNQCGTATSTDATLFVNSVTGGTVGSDQTICSGGDPAAFTESVASTGSGALTYQWQSSTTSCAAGFSDIGGATSATYDVPAGLAVTTYYHRVTTSTLNAVPCTANSGCITVTVNSVTGGTVGSDQAICPGGDPAAFTESVASTGSGALTYQWQSSTTSCAAGFSDIGGATSATYDVPAGLVVTTYYHRVTTSTLNAVLCTATSNCITITFNPTPDAVATPSSQSTCSGASVTPIILTGSVGGTVFNWTRDNTGTVLGTIGASGSGNISGTLINTTASPITVTFTITPTAAGCPGTPITATVTVNPNPAAFVIGGAGTFCPTGTTLTGPVDPNYTYQWGRSLFLAPFSNLGTAQTQAATASGNYQLVVTNQYGCSGTATAIVNVADYVFNGTLGAGDPQQTGRINRFAVISTCAAPKACPGIFTAVGARFYDAYTITNVRNVPVCATIGVNSSCGTNIFSVAYLTSFNPASTCTNYLADPGSSPTNSIFYEATIPANGTIVIVVHEVNVGVGCAGYTLTVDVPRDPSAIVASPSATVCAGTPVTLTAPFANTYLWAPGGAVTQAIVVNTSNTYNVTLGYGNAGCTDSRSQIVTVDPLPTVDPVTDKALCAGSSTAAINFTGSQPGTTFNWTNSNTAIGLGASGTGNIPSFVTTNSGGSAISGTITVTPVIGSCTGTPITFTISVAATPQITSVTGATICGPGIANLSATGTGAIGWYNALTGGVQVNTGATYSPNVAGTTTFYVQAETSAGANGAVTMPGQTSTFPGNVRGYWFTAPTDFVITSLYVPTTASSGNMHVAVVKFTGNVPPPIFASTTNAFTTVFLARNNVSAGSIAVNIPVFAGEVIGILGDRADLNSYAPGPVAGLIFGQPISMDRLGMQFPLSTTDPRDIFREVNANISRIEFTYASMACTSSPRAPVTATVNPIPDATATPASQTTCSGQTITTIAITGTLPGTVFNWTRDNTVNVTGIAASGSGDISGALTNLTASPITVTFTITPTLNGCNGTPVTATVLVNPTPDATATPSSQTICSASPITTIVLTGTVPATVFNWTRDNTVAVTGIAASGSGDISGTLTNTTNAPVTVTFTITPTAFGCTPGAPITATVLVNPTPVATLPANIAYCNGSIVNTGTLNFTSNVAGTTFTWTNSNTAIGLGANGSGATLPTFTATNAGVAPISGTITVTPTANGCPGAPQTFVITVNPIPNAVATPASQTRCSGVAITTIVLTSTTAGTVYNWTRDNTVAVTGIAASGSGNISGTLTNTTAAPVTVTFTITPSYTNGGTTCTGTPITATVLVNPTPNAVGTPASQTICSAASITPIVVTGAVAGTTFTWTRNNTVNVTGIAASGSGTPITGTLTNITNVPQTVTFTITPTANGCTGPTSTATVLVNPTPGVVTPTLQVIITGNGGFADEITWTLTNALNVVVLSGGPYGFNPPATPSGTTPSVNAPYSFFIEAQGTFNDNSCLWEVRCNGVVVASGCIRGTQNGSNCANVGTLTVPNISGCNPLSTQTICSAANIAPITLTGTVAGTTFNWTRDNTVNVTGIAASGSGTISGSLTNTTNVPQTVIFTITPTANGCSGTPVTVSIVVNPTPNAVATPGSQTICSSTAITPIVMTGAVAGTTYAWTRNNTANVTGIAASGTGNISGTLTNTTTALQTTTFTITPTANGCPGPATTATVTVQAPLTIVCPANITVNAAAGTCAANVSFAATVTGTPAPTVTYVPASGSSFPIGTTTVNVTATNICGTVNCSFTVTVLDVQIPVITPLTNRTVCVGSNATFTAVSTFAASYQWQTWNGSAWVNIAGATASSLTINNVTFAMNANSYRVLVTGPCGTVTTSNHAVLYVNQLPTVSIALSNPPLVNPAHTVTITATVSPTGGSFVWFKNNVIVPGATGNTLGPLGVLDVGTYKVTYTDPNGCVKTSNEVEVRAVPSTQLFVYPNPNNGQFHVQFYNESNEAATVTVYNYLGAIVYQKKFTTGPLQYSMIDVDLGQRLAIGTYLVEVRNSKELRIGVKMISVGRQ